MYKYLLYRPTYFHTHTHAHINRKPTSIHTQIVLLVVQDTVSDNCGR